MSIFYRRMQAAFLVVAATLLAMPVNAQLTEQQKEVIREQKKNVVNEGFTGPQQLKPIIRSTSPLGAPVVVNFTERANWALAHPQPIVPRNNEEKEDIHNKFRPQTIRPDAKISPIPVARGNGNGNNLKSSVNSPAPIINVNGTLGNGGVVPPDINAAAGVTYIMEVTNQEFDIFNKTNGSLVSSVDLNTFFNFNGSGNNFLSDPHILYDAPHGRFMACIDAIIVGSTGTFLLAVSETNDPTGNWYVYTITEAGTEVTTADDETLLDFPEMGYNENWVVLTGNQFITGANATTDYIYVMDRATLYAGTTGTITFFSDANSFCISPAQTMDNTTLTEYLVQDANGDNGGTGYIQVGTITGAVGSPQYNVGTQLGVAQPWNENAVEAVQKGTSTTIDADDTRISGSEYINGSLWFAHTAWLPATGTPTYSAADWWQINPAALTVTQFGRITDGSSWYYYPQIYANNRGDAVVGYTASSTTQYATAVYSYHAAADAVNSMENLYTFKSGLGIYDEDRWGDFSAAMVDPVDSSFWVSDGWANTGDTWASQIAHIGSSEPVTVPPLANFLADVTTSCTGTIQFTDYSTNDPTAWLWNFGDGTTSTVQNPSHTYLTSGTFTVSLTATNAYGHNTFTDTAYITITEPAGPVATGATHCSAGTFSLSASTTYPVKWYDSSGMVVSTTNPFVTPVINHTTTYYVQDSTISPVDSLGPVNNTVLGTGGYLTPNYGLNFNVLRAGLLESVYIYAQAAGSVTIYVQNSNGVTVNTATANVPAGGSRFILNFPLAVGTGYFINYSSSIELYRNNEGAAYPYTDPSGIVSITGNNTGTAPAYYYFMYDWHVSDPNCNSQATPVTATVTSGLNTSSATITNVACNGGNTGSVTITPSGGTPNYTYNWSNGQTTATLTSVAAGTYTVSVHDASGCSGTATETITQPGALNVSVTPVNASCGTNSGSISATVSGGTSSYGYSWSNSATTSSITGLAAGPYTLTVTDAHSCTATATASIISSGSLVLSTSSDSAQCFGAATGSTTVTPNGGTGTITYNWSNGGTTATISNVVAGTYLVTVSDVNGCSGTASTTVPQPTALDISVSETNSGCGSPNGSASATVSGGTPGYLYLWSTGGTTASVTSLAAATYTLTVTDNHLCTAVASTVISNSGVLNLSANPNSSNCTGSSSGGASVVINGGTSPFSYNWSNGATTASISGVIAGTYQVTVSDNTGCSGTASVVVVTGTALTLNTSANAANCFNASNGSASVNVTSGTSPYNYNWSNGATTTTITGITAGNYIITVTDANSCQTVDTVVVSQPSAITIFVNSVQPSCYGYSDGSASVTATGGTPNYSYLWSTGSTALGISNLAVASYSVTLTDANTCTSSASFDITNPAQVTGYVSLVNDSCYGSSDGGTRVTASGGTGPYSYLWNNSSTTAGISGLQAGTYTVTITDAHNCTSTISSTISQPTEITASTVSGLPTGGQSNGMAGVNSIMGGTPPYSVSWSNGGNTDTITNLAAGTYTATVTDHNGCQTTYSIALVPGAITTVNDDIAFTLYPNPAKTEITIDAGNLEGETTLFLRDILGQTLITKNITSSATSLDLAGYSDGVYFIELVQNGKRAIQKFVINR